MSEPLIDICHLEKFGFLDLGVIDPQISTREIAEQTGNVIQMPGISLIQTLTPKSTTAAPKNNYSGNFGLNSFPLHTDFAYWYMPPRYFLLRAIIPSKKVATQILHSNECIAALGPLLERAIFKPRRKTDNKLFLLKILQDQVFRWDELFLIPDNSYAAEVVLRIKSVKDSFSVKSVCLELSGQCLLIDNWKVLHGRSAVSDTNQLRVIERAYLAELH